MRRVGREAIKQLLGGLLLVGCMGYAVAAADGEEPASVGATTATTIRPAVATELADNALSRLRPEAAVWLELESGGRTLGLFYPEQDPPANGALVILADVGDNAAAGVADELSRHLTAKGWSVLAVGLPAPSPPLQRHLEAQPEPADADAEDGTEEAKGDGSDDSSVMIDVMASPTGENPEQVYRNRVRQSLAAAAAVLAERSYDQPVLVGLGRASSHLIATDGELQGAPALIWVAPEFYPRDAVALADTLTSGGEVAILELYASRGEASAASQRRWADLRRAGVEQLDRQPVAISRPLSAHGAGALAGRIDAWLKAR
ncbi:DUF3530 family protein [Marinobacter similis]|uniref:DUF3530 family protein n=1 Tax=Marinobacter similis TaxID=1420916 RepID=W5YHQ6_9GAMM|nr:DUF3530 family protein [Marinobacter similis]AHI28626.1 hypothetical protein AU14_08445 [Marinobacter similis]